jgi:hypothetical protein
LASRFQAGNSFKPGFGKPLLLPHFYPSGKGFSKQQRL